MESKQDQDGSAESSSVQGNVMSNVPEIRIDVGDADSGVDSPQSNAENGNESRFTVTQASERERKQSGFQSDLSEISEDGPLETTLDDKRTRKVSIHPGEVSHHYVPHQYRKLSHDVMHVRKLSADILHEARKLSEANLLGVGRKPSISPEFLLSPYGRSGQASRKCSMDAFYSLPGRMSVASLYAESGEDTMEALPKIENYRDLFNVLSSFENQRPTLDELRDDERCSSPRTPTSPKEGLFDDELRDIVDEEKPKQPEKVEGGLKFGWIQGVLVRCLLNIFGVMLFLRLTWVTGQAGIGFASIVILLSMVVTFITTASMSAICTNGEVKGGGAYYMISRSLGPEFGGSIGVVFSLANAIAAAMYIVGFAETVQDLMTEFNTTITGDRMNDVRIIGAATAVVLLGILIIGMEWEAKAQLGLLVVLTVAIINYFVGTFLPPTDEKKWKGVVGYNVEVFKENFGPDFREGNSFFSVFSIFFPAATGILAGANISGDLKNPSSAIPKGTFLAILLTGIIYLGMAWVAGSCILRDAVGPILLDAVVNQTEPVMTYEPTLDMIPNCSFFNTTCKYGLQNDNGAVGIASGFRPLILAGIFSATLSSALASMVGAPKVFQALGKDKLFPFIEFFAKGYGKSDEPRRGYILTFFICVAMTCIGALDLIAPIISNFFLMAYALINYSCFMASFANTPGFRPAFRFYNQWVSLLGALACLAIMFLINWSAALITFVIVGGLYMYVRVKGPEVNWGSSTQAQFYKDALTSTMKLVKIEEHVKNFRPQILVMSGYPRNRPQLIDFVSSITKKQSLLICGHVFRGEMSEHVKNVRSMAAYKWFEKRKTKAFYNSVVTPTLRIGTQVLMQALGIGKLRPNTLIVGFKNNWQKDDPFEVEDYVSIISDAFDLNYGVGILRVPEGLDINRVPDTLIGDDEVDSDEEIIAEHSSDEEDMTDEGSEKKTSISLSEVSSDIAGDSKSATCTSYKFTNKNVPSNNITLKRLNTVEEGLENKAYESDQESGKTNETTEKLKLRDLLHSESIELNVGRFRGKQKGTIDVWWLYDDGGLTLLIPYILSLRKKWKHCDLRVFCAGTKTTKPHEDELRMASLLAKFRIKYTQLTVLPDLWKKPTLAMYHEFETMIRKWRLRSNEYQEDMPWKITENDLKATKAKTYRHLRLREQLLIHSPEASLIVMTLPIPKKTSCPSGLYMSWIEMLSRGLPPMLLLRGNQQNVLTYYS